MSRWCIYCRTAYEEDITQCPECKGRDFRYITSEQFEKYNGKKVRRNEKS
jgi:predicted  nucleic acid-binding Zn-ribbon protein